MMPASLGGRIFKFLKNASNLQLLYVYPLDVVRPFLPGRFRGIWRDGYHRIRDPLRPGGGAFVHSGERRYACNRRRPGRNPGGTYLKHTSFAAINPSLFSPGLSIAGRRALVGLVGLHGS